MKNIVFIHGAYHAGWCWENLIKLLPNDQFLCHPLDLPGQGKNKIATPKNKVTTQDYINYVLDYVKKNNFKDVIFVSHSLGGTTLSKIIELIPNKISHAFFLTSVILNGDSFLDKFPLEIQERYKQVASSREDNSIPPNIERIKSLLFSGEDDSPELENFLSKLEPQPIGPYTDIITLEDFKQSKTPITYIKCRNDLSLPKETFEEIISNLPVGAKITEIDANHEAMFSKSETLAQLLISET